MSNEWRRVVAALANDDRRAVYAEAVLGMPGTASARRDKHVRSLQNAGLLTAEGAPTDVFAHLLSEHPAEAKQGVDRWLRDGRIDHYPAKPSHRRELLDWVAARAIGAGERLDEKHLGERLAEFTTDVATLRRYLVDAGLLTRDAIGSVYERGTPSL